MSKEIFDSISFIEGSITKEEFENNYPTKYKLTDNDIKEMQNDADRELFGSGSSY
jgi:hypothetical protein